MFSVSVNGEVKLPLMFKEKGSEWNFSRTFKEKSFSIHPLHLLHCSLKCCWMRSKSVRMCTTRGSWCTFGFIASRHPLAFVQDTLDEPIADSDLKIHTIFTIKEPLIDIHANCTIANLLSNKIWNLVSRYPKQIWLPMRYTLLEKNPQRNIWWLIQNW